MTVHKQYTLRVATNDGRSVTQVFDSKRSAEDAGTEVVENPESPFKSFTIGETYVSNVEYTPPVVDEEVVVGEVEEA